jgi:hypothetical protein
MGKPNSLYLRQFEVCKRMASQTKLPQIRLAWLELAAKWFALAESHRPIEARQASAHPSSPTLHLKKFTGLTR